MKFSTPQIGLKEKIAVLRSLNSKQLSQGKRVNDLEREFSKLHGRAHGVATNSGTSALHLTLIAMGVQPGDEILVPAISFAATANAAAMIRAKPVFIDIDLSTFNMDLDLASERVSNKTRAIIPVDLFGNPISRERLQEFSRTSGLRSLIDSSQSHLAISGAETHVENSFTSTYSFYPTKNMTTGEGGMVLTNDESLANILRMLRNQGMSEDNYQYEMVGLNNRMTDLAASLGLVQLGRLRGFTQHRMAIAEIYKRHLYDQRLQQAQLGATHVYHQFTFLAPVDRDGLVRALATDGVPTRVYYPKPLNKIKPYFEEQDLPNAKFFSDHCLSLPIGPHITISSAKRVASKVRKRLSSGW